MAYQPFSDVVVALDLADASFAGDGLGTVAPASITFTPST